MNITRLPETDTGTLAVDDAAIGSGDLPRTVSKADLDAGKLVYTPPANASGAGYADFEFTVSDGSAESASATTTINVLAVNDAPTTSDGTVSTNEDTAYTFDAGDFAFSDADAGDALASVKITRLPETDTGTLALDGTTVTLDQVVTKANLDANKLVYTPPANASGAGYADFEFTVSDGTAESASATTTINVLAVNDAPTTSDGTVSTDEDTAYTFEAGDFAFSDVDTGDALASVKITRLPETGTGTLALDGTTVTLDQVVTKANLDANKLVYTPPANASGAGYADFEFTVSDGTAESASATTTINVLAVNDTPTTSDGAVSTDEDTAYTFEAGDFAFSDADTGDALASVKITRLPETGTLALDGTAVTADQVVTKADLDANKLVYTPPANANGDGYADFEFTVSDGTAESASATTTIDVLAVNDAPTTSDGTVRTNENTAYTFRAGDFAFSDVDTGDALASVKITRLPETARVRWPSTARR